MNNQTNKFQGVAAQGSKVEPTYYHRHKPYTKLESGDSATESDRGTVENEAFQREPVSAKHKCTTPPLI
jgi:hypothetical protein